ncbi:Phosphatidyl-N-methylethanolamine N-methyltransferase [Cryptotrichosporon argae]
MSKLLDALPAPVRAHLALDNAGYTYETGAGVVDWAQPSLYAAVAMVFFNPIYWNIVARNEYRNKTLTRIFGRQKGVYALALSIFSLGIFRDAVYQHALQRQPHHALLSSPGCKALAAGLFLLGQLFVVTSIYALGITGTYLGDYFGILMPARVTGFPFNVLEDPMYVGSTLAFLGTAIWYESPVGIALSALVWAVYYVALQFEGPFTAKIYSSASSAAPSTPRRSARKAEQTTPSSKPTASSTPSESSASATASSTSYAAAAAQPTGADGLPSTAPSQPIGVQTPRRRAPRASHVAGEGVGVEVASPMRVTRSRSKARMSESE